MLEKIKKIAELKNNFDLIPLLENAKIDNKQPTCYVKDKSNFIYYNENFLNSLSLNKAYFVFNHEFLHLVYNHCERSKNHENAKISNIAADIIVNEKLEKILKIKIPKGCCIRTNEQSLTFETLYQELLQNNNQENKKPNINDLVIEEIKEDIENKEIKEAISSMASKLQEIELKEFNVEIKNQNKITLFEFLKHKVGKLIKYEHQRNWQRINRYNIECMPNYRNIVYKPKIDIYIDVSGSMEDKPLKIIENIILVKNKLKNYKADYFVFNTDIKKIDINNNKINIGGGTDITKVISSINPKSDLSIILTDCEDDYINNNEKIIFISNNKKGDIICDENFEKILKV